ncbi:hypothetical protein PROFUN_12986 [Planoprotostelium fungivorum]|uniref:Delta(24(24(1)))-sterol reductase n=1 Tax=Planoprotostelium fungivorum TaxID=1890364 RepID=A0A2P6N618_9EUKA|nr:hypothetical protein PROFUN_12986 [Planoprotostelium fungivorum]
MPQKDNDRRVDGGESKGDATDLQLDREVVMEFGGPLGVTAMMLGFPCLMYYFWFSLKYHQGAIFYPTSFDDILPFFQRLSQYFWQSAAPTVWGFQTYGIFCLISATMAAFMPGPHIKGMPIPSLGGKSLDYTCNGVYSWYLLLVVSIVLHVTGVFRLTQIIDHFGELMTAAISFGFIITLLTYLFTMFTPVFGKPHRMSGNIIYDIFMGAPLNPRIGPLDLKLWAEIRVPWIILFYISLSCLLKQYEWLARQVLTLESPVRTRTYGFITAPQAFMVLAHVLYVNACQKGEECIPTTWDIFYEKWGFMLIFWNLAGVPFTYCMSSLYLSLVLGPISWSTSYTVLCYVVLLAAYYAWDTTNSQKCRFRMQQRGIYIERKTFPQLPWGTIKNPRYIKTEHGNLLLTDGWYRYARKFHYTADLVMALSWGIITGFSSFLPYFYPCFFVFVLTHRVVRDNERCAKKYGKDWEKYVQTVPYIFIPYVF